MYKITAHDIDIIFTLRIKSSINNFIFSNELTQELFCKSKWHNLPLGSWEYIYSTAGGDQNNSGPPRTC